MREIATTITTPVGGLPSSDQVMTTNHCKLMLNLGDVTILNGLFSFTYLSTVVLLGLEAEVPGCHKRVLS